jgi:hypothetical protein
MLFNQLQQGSSVLFAITSNVVGNKLLSKTLDMQGRTQAVQLMQNMAEGFSNINVPDPNKLKPFIESVTGSVMAIMDVSEYYGSPSFGPKPFGRKSFDQDSIWPTSRLFCKQLCIKHLVDGH